MPEVEIDVERADAIVGNAQFAHPPAAVAIQWLKVAEGKVLGVLDRIGGDVLRRDKVRSAQQRRRRRLLAAELAGQSLRHRLEPGDEFPDIHAIKLAGSACQVQHGPYAMGQPLPVILPGGV